MTAKKILLNKFIKNLNINKKGKRTLSNPCLTVGRSLLQRARLIIIKIVNDDLLSGSKIKSEYLQKVILFSREGLG